MHWKNRNTSLLDTSGGTILVVTKILVIKSGPRMLGGLKVRDVQHGVPRTSNRTDCAAKPVSLANAGTMASIYSN